MVKSVEYAKKNGLYVSVNGEDASRADRDFLIEFIEAAKQAGADRFRYCDTVGVMEPFKIKEDIKIYMRKQSLILKCILIMILVWQLQMR